MGEMADFLTESHDLDWEDFERPTLCKYCHRDCVWRILDGKWRLHTYKTEKLHMCKQYLEKVKFK